MHHVGATFFGVSVENGRIMREEGGEMPFFRLSRSVKACAAGAVRHPLHRESPGSHSSALFTCVCCVPKRVLWRAGAGTLPPAAGWAACL